MKYVFTAFLIVIASSLFGQENTTLYIRNSSHKYPCRVSVGTVMYNATQDFPQGGVPLEPNSEGGPLTMPVWADHLILAIHGAGMTHATTLDGPYPGKWTLVITYKRKHKYWATRMIKRKS